SPNDGCVEYTVVTSPQASIAVTETSTTQWTAGFIIFAVSAPDTISPSMITIPNLLAQPVNYPWAGNTFYAQGHSWQFFYNYEKCPDTGSIQGSCLKWTIKTDGT